jgi:hypothetical protein
MCHSEERQSDDHRKRGCKSRHIRCSYWGFNEGLESGPSLSLLQSLLLPGKDGALSTWSPAFFSIQHGFASDHTLINVCSGCGYLFSNGILVVFAEPSS